MTPQHAEYVEKALKTAAALGNPIYDLTHAALGLCDEAEELTQAIPGSMNMLEELGDLLWFAALAGNVIFNEAELDVWPDNGAAVETRTPEYWITEIIGAACAIAGLIKKPFAYGGSKPVPYKKIASRVTDIIIAVQATATAHGWDMRYVQEANIAKLGARYKGGGFNSDNALNRNTDAEMAAITK